MAKDKHGVRHRDWVPRRENETPTEDSPHVHPEREHRDRYKTVVDEPEATESLTDRAKGSRYWLKAHGDDWIERALMKDIMDYRARLIYEFGASSQTNPYRTTNLARRLKIHNSAMSQWANLRQFPKSFAAWRRLCRALKLELRIEVVDRKGNVLFSGLG